MSGCSSCAGSSISCAGCKPNAFKNYTDIDDAHKSHLNKTEDCQADGTNETLSFAKDAISPDNPKYVPPEQCIGELDLSTSDCADSESALHAALMAETLNIGGGPVNLFPLLGFYNQGSTIDQCINGNPIHSGCPSGFNISDAFNINEEGWRSIQLGCDVPKNSFIGYDFGTKKAWEKIGPPQERYVSPAPVRKHIQSIKLKQSKDKQNRAKQIRVEACDDNLNWVRIDVIQVPDNDLLNTLKVRHSAEYRYWRFIPVFFNGISSNSSWEIIELHLFEASVISLDLIQDQLFLENRDRAYCRTSVFLKCLYDIVDQQTYLSKFGIDLPTIYTFTISFVQMIHSLGRPIIIGDILELPSEMQYDHRLNGVRRWLEVTDTGWSTEGYTHNWKPNLFRFSAQPILPSIEHRDLLGMPKTTKTAQSDQEFMDGNFLLNNQAHEQTDFITQEADSHVPQTGTDPQDIISGMSNYGTNGSYDGKDIYIEDGIPPNGLPYTIGDSLPESPNDKDYHRQTYTYIDNPVLRPPDRLVRYNSTSKRWKVIEVNTRKKYESHKPTMSKFIESQTSVEIDQHLL